MKGFNRNVSQSLAQCIAKKYFIRLSTLPRDLVSPNIFSTEYYWIFIRASLSLVVA